MTEWCHPTHAQRTKCVCGNVLSLSGAVGTTYNVCKCGRRHSKEPGSAFERGSIPHDGRLITGQRKGGRAGCPGVFRRVPEDQERGA